MNTRLNSRIKGKVPEKSTVARLLDEAGYMLLSFAALWASVRFSYFTGQFLALAVILGLKWVFGKRVQVIQIFYSERKESI